MLTCTWAPTSFVRPRIFGGDGRGPAAAGAAELRALMAGHAERIEGLGISHLLIAQRWWGSGEEMEGSTLDCLAMTGWFAHATERLKLITAVHPGFFQPAPLAKWAASMDLLCDGRWAINVTTGWNMREFDMYGVERLGHDERYARSAEFLGVLRGAWAEPEFTFHGRFYRVEGLRLEPRPAHPLTVFQGGQSDAAIELAAHHSDWMFMNGGSEARIAGIIERVRQRCLETGRKVRFAMYANPLCRATDEAAWEEIEARLSGLDPALVARRRAATSGAEGMWADADESLAALDTNEGFAARLIGTPDTILRRVERYRALGVEMLHLNLGDELFEREVLPEIVRA